MNNMTSEQIIERMKNGDTSEAMHFEYVKARIRECNNMNTLRAMLLDTLENAKNGYELAEDITTFYLD